MGHGDFQDLQLHPKPSIWYTDTHTKRSETLAARIEGVFTVQIEVIFEVPRL
jgi:hypothetical protein